MWSNWPVVFVSYVHMYIQTIIYRSGTYIGTYIGTYLSVGGAVSKPYLWPLPSMSTASILEQPKGQQTKYVPKFGIYMTLADVAACNHTTVIRRMMMANQQQVFPVCQKPSHSAGGYIHTITSKWIHSLCYPHVQLVLHSYDFVSIR